MTRVEITTTICDLDGAQATPVRFAVDGRAYELDLCAADKEAMYTGLRPYLTAARPASRRSPQALRSLADREQAAAVREWAIEHAPEYGWRVGERGRIPAAVYPAYRAANGGRS